MEQHLVDLPNQEKLNEIFGLDEGALFYNSNQYSLIQLHQEHS